MPPTPFDLPVDANASAAYGFWRQSYKIPEIADNILRSFGLQRVWEARRPGTSNDLHIWVTGYADDTWGHGTFKGTHADALEAAMEGRLTDSSHPSRHSTPPEAWRVFAMPHPWRLLIASADGSKIERVLTLEKP